MSQHSEIDYLCFQSVLMDLLENWLCLDLPAYLGWIVHAIDTQKWIGFKIGIALCAKCKSIYTKCILNFVLIVIMQLGLDKFFKIIISVFYWKWQILQQMKVYAHEQNNYGLYMYANSFAVCFYFCKRQWQWTRWYRLHQLCTVYLYTGTWSILIHTSFTWKLILSCVFSLYVLYCL